MAAGKEGCLNMQRRKVIGVCGSRLFNQIPMSFINRLRAAASPEGYHVIAFSANIGVESVGEVNSGEEQLFELARDMELSALIILTETLCDNTEIARNIAEIGRSKGIPVFSVDGVVEGCFNLTMEYHDGFERVMRHVVEEHHCRRVNMIAGFENSPLSQERIEVYKRVLRENGIPFEEERLAYGDFWDRPTRKYMEAYLNGSNELPEAFVCANDAMAITVCSVLNAHGYEVPEDVIVTGFDGTRDAKCHFPIMTTSEPDYTGAVAFIMEKIMECETGECISPCDHTIPFCLKKSQSCGCEPKVMHEINTVLSSFAYDLGDCSWHNLAMNNMVTSLVDKTDIMEVAYRLPKFVGMWSSNFRFACLRTDIAETCERTLHNTDMTTILWVNKGEFRDPGERFPVSEFVPHMEEVFRESNEIDTLVVRLLNSGQRVYGYTVEGFQELDDRKLQRSNEFAMFLTVCIDTVLHNHKMAELNENLSQAYEKISALYILDPLTKLYNRRGFFKRLDEEMAKKENAGKYLYLFSFDMDGLKMINDTYGHAEGDFAIVTLAEAIRMTIGEQAVCARFGGDEFTAAVFAEGADRYEDISEKLRESIAASEEASQKPYAVGSSVGMICEKMEGDMNTEAMLLAADRRMYADKLARGKERR